MLVEVAGAGACHSDLSVMMGKFPIIEEFPMILGHENAGRVAALGPGVEGLDEGEAVAVFGAWGCGMCIYCTAGLEHMCDESRWVGHGPPGGYAQYLVVPARRHLEPIGDLDPVEAACLTDAGLTSYRAVRRALPRLAPGSVAVAIGIGGLGHMGLQYLKTLSTACVIAVDTAPGARELATRLGADVALDPGDVDVIRAVKDLGDGEGADVVIDFVGSDATLAVARQATMYGIRVARAHTAKSGIAVFEGSYHGAHDAVLVQAEDRSPRDRPAPVPMGRGIPDATIEDVLMLPYRHEAAFDLIRQNRDRLAVVLVEPVQGANPTLDCGEFLRELAATCRDAGVLLLFDEVITGFRLAYGGAQEEFGVMPDLAAYGKALGGGLPIGAVAGRADIMQRFEWQKHHEQDDRVFAGGTFGGKPPHDGRGDGRHRSSTVQPGALRTARRAREELGGRGRRLLPDAFDTGAGSRGSFDDPSTLPDGSDRDGSRCRPLAGAG